MTKQIELTQGQFAIVDDVDYEWASEFKWHTQRGGNTFYAARKAGIVPFRKTKLLHREIMQPPDGVHVDHIDGDGLNCTRANMRIATYAQNGQNRTINHNNKSGYKGVSWHKRNGKWQARIAVNSKHIHLGYFATPIEAARAYDEAAKKYHGRFAKTNF